MSIPVLPAGRRYAAAISELPRSASRASGPAGAVVAFAAGASPADVEHAVERGAAAVIVEPAARLEPGLIERLAGVAERVPVIVVRRRLRAVLHGPADQGRAAALAAQASVIRSDRGSALRDLVGLMRLLGGGDVGVTDVSGGDRSLVAQVDVRDDDGVLVPGSLVVASRSTGRSLLRVTAIGPTRVEAVAGGPDDPVRVTLCDARGEMLAPQVLESAEREAVRRALETVAVRREPTDLADLIADERVARRLDGARP